MKARFARVLTILMMTATVAGLPGIGQTAQAPPAPAFALELFNGQTLRLADLKNKVVVLLFWAEW